MPPAVLSYAHTLPVPLGCVDVPVKDAAALLMRMVTFRDLWNPRSLWSQVAFLQFTYAPLVANNASCATAALRKSALAAASKLLRR